jgi:flagellar biogenesis protein FliO
MGAPESDLPGFGASLLLSLFSLAVVALVAYVTLRWLSRTGLGGRTNLIRVLGRCTLEPRRSLYLVESAGRCFLIGVGDGAIGLVAEIDQASLPAPAPAATHASGGVVAVLKRWFGRGA